MQSLPQKLSAAEKLEILRRVDCFHPWASLDDERQCRRCGEIITGHEIEISGGSRGHESLRLNCPTKGCCSVPIEWLVLEPEPNPKTRPMRGVAGPKLLSAELPISAAQHYLSRVFRFVRVPRVVL